MAYGVRANQHLSPASPQRESLVQQVDALFQSFHASLKELESPLLATDPQLSEILPMVDFLLNTLKKMIVSNLKE